MKSGLKLFGGAVLCLSIFGSLSGDARAVCATDSYVSAVCWTAAEKCPQNFAVAAGQTLPIRSNETLYSMIGATYGGDGRNTFALPDLRGRTAIGVGQAPGLQPADFGVPIGQESTRLYPEHLPEHQHGISLQGNASANVKVGGEGEQPNAAKGYPAARPDSGPPPTRRAIYSGSIGFPTAMADDVASITLSPDSRETQDSGKGDPISLRPPQLVMLACIALQGKIPPRE